MQTEVPELFEGLKTPIEVIRGSIARQNPMLKDSKLLYTVKEEWDCTRYHPDKQRPYDCNLRMYACQTGRFALRGSKGLEKELAGKRKEEHFPSLEHGERAPAPEHHTAPPATAAE